uniref:DRBM domain-containing protein n=1 Tax=Arundo donax TaxID=35708 RepID=A0A0A9EW25_ARUDO
MENKVPDVLSLEVPAGKDPMDELTDCAVHSFDEANGCNKGHVQHVNCISFTDNESARSRLPKICTAIGWKEPSYDFEEQGPPHNKLFTCKVTVHVAGIVNTVMECFGDPKHQKEAAQEHAAQGALWCLQRYGHVK